MTDFNRKVNITAGDKSGVASIQAAANAAKGMQQEVSKAKTATVTLNDAMAELAHQNRLAAISRDAAKYAQETGNARAAQLKLNAELTKFGATANEIRSAARAYDREYTKAVKDAQREQQRLNDTFKEFDDRNSETRRRSGLYGDVDTSVSTVRGAIDTFSPGSGKALEAVQDIFAAREAIENLGPPLQYIKANAATAVPGLLALGAAGLAFAALGATLALVTQRANEAREASRRAAETTIEGLNAEQEARYLAERQRFDELQQRIDAEREASIVGANSLNSYREEIDRLNEVFKNFNAEGEGAGFSNRQQIVDEIARLREEMESAAETASDSQTRLKALTDVQKEYARQIRESEALKDLEVAEKELDTVRQQHGVTLAQLKQQEDELNAAYKASAEARRASRELSDNRENEDRAIADKRAAEDLQRALEAQAEAHKANLLSIEKRAADAITAAREALAQKEIQAYQQIAAAQAAYQKKQAEDLRKFQLDQKRDLEDFRRAQKRAEQDYRRSQLENLINNDITGVILDEQSFNTDRRRGRQDFRRDRGRAQEDFDTEQQKQFEALQERIAGIQQELEAFRVATAEKIVQIEAQKVADLQAAQVAFEEKLRLDQEARDLQNQRDAEDLQLRLDRRAEDRRNEDEAARVALQSSLDRITQQKTAQDAALDSAIAKANAFKLIVESTRLPTGIAPTPGVPVPTIPSYGGYIPTPGSDAFYEKPRPLPVAPAPKGNAGGGGFGAGFSMPSSVAGGGRGGGQTINVYIDGKPAGGANKPLVDAIAMGIREAIYNPQVGASS